MVYIQFWQVVALITALWGIVRTVCCLKKGSVSLKRELQLMLVYICIVVVARFAFFPFSKVDGKIQPLVLEMDKIFSWRINWVPFVNLTDYPTKREILINFIGNWAMFIPLGIVWPVCFNELNSHKKVILAGVGCSLVIEILQLPFYSRVSDIDDLLLNSLGFIAGYGIYLLVRRLGKRLAGK